jgi:hypothetical protein
MANIRTVTPEDKQRYGDILKGKEVGDTITAAEDYELRKNYAEKHNEPVPQAVDPATGVTGIPSSIEGEESEADETKATLSTRKYKK